MKIINYTLVKLGVYRRFKFLLVLCFSLFAINADAQFTVECDADAPAGPAVEAAALNILNSSTMVGCANTITGSIITTAATAGDCAADQIVWTVTFNADCTALPGPGPNIVGATLPINVTITSDMTNPTETAAGVYTGGALNCSSPVPVEANFTAPTGTDGTTCGGTVTANNFNITPNNNAAGCLESYTAKWDLVDACGNTLTDAGEVEVPVAFAAASAIPINGSATVTCGTAASDPGKPTDRMQCGVTLVAVADAANPMVSTPDPCPFTQYTVTYVYTYTLCNGDTEDWEFVYTVGPNAKPSAPTAVAVNVECASDAELADVPATFPADLTEPCTSDAIAAATGVETTNTVGACDGSGQIVYTYTYTFCDNTTTTTTYTFNINDTADPTPVCPTTPPVVNISFDATACTFAMGTLNANALAGGNSTDGCDMSPTETSPLTTYSCTDVGTQMVTLTATDCNGNDASTACAVTVVLDPASFTFADPPALCPDDAAFDVTTLIGGATCGTFNGDFVTAAGMFDPSLAADTDGDGAPGPGSYAITYCIGDLACQLCETRNIHIKGQIVADDVQLADVDAGCLVSGDVYALQGMFEGADDDGDGFSTISGGTFTISAGPTGTLAGSLSASSYVYTGGTGTVTIQYAINDCGGTAVTSTAVLTIAEEPTGSFDLPSTMCQNDADFDLTSAQVPTPADATAAGWTIAYSGTGVAGTTFDPAQTAGDIVITMTITNGACTFEQDQTVRILQSGDPAFTVTSPICEITATQTLTLTSTADPAGGTLTNDNIRWFGTGVVDAGADGTLTHQGPGIYTVCVEVGDPACAEISCEDIVVEPEIAAPDLIADFEVCLLPDDIIDFSSLLDADDVTGGAFTVVEAGITGVLSPNQYEYNGGCGTLTVTYTLTDNSVCTDPATAEVVITINEKPVIDIVAPGPLCVLDAAVQIVNNGSATAAGCTAATGVFSGTGITDGGDGMTAIFDPAAAGEGVHMITYTSFGAAPCGIVEIFEIVVNAAGDPVFTVTSPVCVGNTQTLELTSAHASLDTDDEVVWFGGDGVGGIVVDGGLTGTFEAVASGFYTVCVRTGDPSCSQTFCQTVEVDMTPPMITCPATQTLDLGANCDVAVPDLVALTSASDDCGMAATPITQSIAAGQLISSDITVTLTATDNAGNTSTCDVLLQVSDKVAPTITCPAMVNVNIDSQCDFVLPNFTSSAVSGDNCGVAKITQLPVVGTPITAAGTTVVTLSITDDAGNPAVTCMFNVVVADGDGPTAICANKTVVLDANGAATITAADVDAGSFDNCVSPVALSIDDDAFDCTDIGTPAAVVLTATAGGMTDMCTAWVTVLDQTAPVLAGCPADMTVMTGAGATSCDAIATWTAPTFTDNCSATVSSSHVSGATFPVGQTTVVYTGVDPSGNATTCEFTVTVEDNTIPTITCPATVNVNVDSQCDFVLPNFTSSAVSGDNCGVATITQLPVAGTLITAAGTTPVTLTITDDAGNPAVTCMFNVVVADGDGPTAICKNITLALDANGAASIAAADIDGGSFDNCLGTVDLAVDQTAFACSDIGTPVSVTLTATAGLLTDQCTSIVTVVDQTAPTTTCPADVVVMTGATATDCSATATWTGPTFADNCSVTVTSTHTSGATFLIGETSVVYTGVDPSGNATTCEFTVTVEDNTAPTITCPTDKAATVNSSCNFVLPDYTGGIVIGDNCGVASILQSPAPGTVYMSAQTVAITITVTDNAGNANATCTFDLVLTDSDAPIALCQDITVPLDATGNVSITAANISNNSAENCGIMSSIIDIDAFTCADLGNNIVTLTVTDDASNMSTCTANVMVVDNTAPTFTCPASPMNTSGCDGLIPNLLNGLGEADECSSTVTLTQNPVAGTSIGGAGNSANVTITATDDSGNAHTCMVTINVIDSSMPSFQFCPPTIEVNAFAGQCEAFAYWQAPVAVDNCALMGAGSVVQDSGPSPGTLSVGDHSVTYKATDADGNEAECTIMVKVIDKTPPTFITTIPLQVTAECDAIPATFDFNPAWHADDNCSDDVTFELAEIRLDEVCPNTYTLKRTWTIMDASGNKAEHVQKVFVQDTTDPTPVCQNLSIMLSGGTATITPAMIDNGSTDNCSTNLTLALDKTTFDCDDAGSDFTVTLTVTDECSNDATCTSTVEIQGPKLESASIVGTNVSCPGSNDGAAVVTVVGGKLPLIYDWSHGANTAEVTDLAPGDYTVHIIDANGCTVSANVTITESSELDLSIAGTDVTCSNGGHDGAVDLTVNNGTAPYTYIWAANDAVANGATTQDLAGISVGDYTVTVTDVNGCSKIQSVTIGAPADCIDEVMIVDPCSCTNPSNVTLADGTLLLQDVVRIIPTPGSTITSAALTSHDNKLLDATGAPLSQTAPFLIPLAGGGFGLEIYTRPFDPATFSVDVVTPSGTQSFTGLNTMSDCNCTVTNSTIPTMSEWGLLIFALMILNLGLVFVYRQELVLAGAANISMSAVPFDKKSFVKYFWIILLGLAIVFLISIIGFGYELMTFDIPGSILTAGLLAYMSQFIKKK